MRRFVEAADVDARYRKSRADQQTEKEKTCDCGSDIPAMLSDSASGDAAGKATGEESTAPD